MKKITLAVGMALLCLASKAQVSVTATTLTYTQNFNSLSDTGLNNPYSTLPAGWKALELGSGANTQYRAAHGQLAGGDIYSFGDSLSTERALGSIGSGTVGPTYFGLPLVNNTGAVIQNVAIAYRGEVWRIGNPTRSTGPDTLHFAWGKNVSSLATGAWNAFTTLNFVSPAAVTAPQNVPANGNAAAQVVVRVDTLTSLALAPGDTLWVRWRDENSSSFDDGLAVDSVTVRFLPTPASPYLSLNAFNTYYHQNFDTLSSTSGALVSFNTLPRGWFASESGPGADNTYRVAYGELAGGNLYSFGDSLGTDRALGSIGSGSVLVSRYGAAWINNTGTVVNHVEIKYTGEQWRQGRNLRPTGPDTLHFSWAKNSNGIADTIGYNSYSALNFFAPVTTAALNTPLDGNDSANRTRITGLLSGIALQPNDTLWIRWEDFDSNSFDDGLGLDSFSLAAVLTPAVLNIEFKQNTTTVAEQSGIVSIPLVIHNKNNFLSQVEVFIADTGNVNIATDLSISSGVVSFSSTNPDTIAYFQFGLQNSLPFEGNEYFVLGLRNPANANLGSILYDTVRIINYTYPTVALSALSSDDTQGRPDSLNRTARVEGIVHGVNYSAGGGLDFYILENGSGINVYRPAGQPSSYIPTPGDKLSVWGKVGVFRGLTRMEAIDSIGKLSGGNALETPTVVGNVSEATESKYLRVDSVKLAPAVTSWPSNLVVRAVKAGTTDTISIYVSGNSDLAGTAAPTDYFSITGIGSQFNNSTNLPYSNGYRLMAVNRAFITPASVEVVVGSKAESLLAVYPNPFNAEVSVRAPFRLETVTVFSLDGRRVWSGNSASTQCTIPSQSWKPGAYLIRASGEGKIETLTIIKR